MHEAVPVVVIERHHSRKSGLDGDPIQKNTKRCKNPTTVPG
jgi:hypothetical protein